MAKNLASFGTSSHAAALRTTLKTLASTRENIVLLGEPGVGKRYVALMLHRLTFPRAHGGFMEITPHTGEEELRVTLFEEERKKFEGVFGRPLPQLGLQSTLLVRNIHEFSFLSQTRVARFVIQNDALPQRKARAVRVVFSLPDRWEEFLAGRMLIDSLDAFLKRYRRMTVPPLRDRREDIPALVHQFLRSFAGTGGKPLLVSEATLHRLGSLPYYDNIRELKLLIKEGVRISKGEMLALPDIVLDEADAIRKLLDCIVYGRKAMIESSMEALEKALIRRALVRCDYDRTKAASLLGLSEVNLRYRLRKFNLPSFA